MSPTIPENNACLAGLDGAALVLSCEHGGNRIPMPYQSLFQPHRELLHTHRGYDPGALVMARELSKAFGAPLVSATVSRLLVDLNRSVGHPRLHHDALPRVPADVRRQVLKAHYQPYRQEAEQMVRDAIGRQGRVVHLSCHSFTPELDGKVRQADIGILYDPARPGEVAFSGRWKAALEARAPDLTVRRNYPYAGKGDGLTAWFRRRLPPEIYVGIELELNQKHVFRAGRHWAALRQLIVDSLGCALALPDTDA